MVWQTSPTIARVRRLSTPGAAGTSGLIAVGGTPESVVRAATLGLPMALAIIGGMPERFAPLASLYRDAARRAGHDPSQLDISINSHGFIGDDSRQAANDYFPSYAAVMSKIGRERIGRPSLASSSKRPAHCAAPILLAVPRKSSTRSFFQHQLFGHQRPLLQLGVGTIDHLKAMRAIELLGVVVVRLCARRLGGSGELIRASPISWFRSIDFQRRIRCRPRTGPLRAPGHIAS